VKTTARQMVELCQMLRAAQPIAGELLSDRLRDVLGAWEERGIADARMHALVVHQGGARGRGELLDLAAWLLVQIEPGAPGILRIGVVPTIGGAAGATMIMAFLGKRLIDHRLGKELDRYRSELGERTESLKTELSIYAHQYTVELSCVDAQCADAIRAVFRAMRRWQSAVSALAAGTDEVAPTSADVWRHTVVATEAADTAGREYLNILADNAIYLDGATFNDVYRAADDDATRVAQLLHHIREAQAVGYEGESAPEVEELRHRLSAYIHSELLPAHQQLTKHFRRQLGVERE
jgi:hypothetical protein